MEQYIQKGKTEMLMEQEQLKRECINYFKQHTIWKKVFNGFRKRISFLWKTPGTVVLKNLSAEDIEELEGFFGMNFHGKKRRVGLLLIGFVRHCHTANTVL